MDVADRSDRPEVLGGLNPSLRPTRRYAPGSTESLCGRDTSRSTRDVLIAGGGGRVARLLLFRPSGW
jgi:hypothetical protein